MTGENSFDFAIPSEEVVKLYNCHHSDKEIEQLKKSTLDEVEDRHQKMNDGREAVKIQGELLMFSVSLKLAALPEFRDKDVMLRVVIEEAQ